MTLRWVLGAVFALAFGLAAGLVGGPAQAALFQLKCDRTDCALYLTGEIAHGDARSLLAQISASPRPITSMVLRSPGGDPVEALAISDVMNRYFITAVSDHRDLCGPHVDQKCAPCSGACALVFMTANVRLGEMVNVRRPGLRRTGAGGGRGDDRIGLMLKARGVPQRDIETVMSTPSGQLRPLRADYEEYSPSTAAWIAARCPRGPDPAQRANDIVSHAVCTTHALRGEAIRSQRILRFAPAR